MAGRDERAHYKVTFAVLLASVASFALLQSLVSPVLPTIQRSLHTSQDTVTWVLTAYLVSASVFTPIVGRIGDMVGKGRMLVFTLGALAAGALLAALASSIMVLIIARVIQGAGGAVFPLAFGIIRDEFPATKVGEAVGITAATGAVGGGLGTIIAGPIVGALDYHWLFWLPLIVVSLAAITAHFFVPESPVRTPGRVNWVAAMLLSGWLVAVLVGVSEGTAWGWTSPRVLGLFGVSVVLAVAWVAVEVRSAVPLVDMRMMRIPAVWTTNVVALLFGAVLYSALAFLPEFLQTPRSTGYGLAASITGSGVYLLPQTAGMFLLGMVSGRMARAVGSKLVLVVGSVIIIFPFVMLAYAHDRPWEIYAAASVLGIGMGLAFSAIANIIVEAVPRHQTGVASGMNTNIRTVGGAIGAAIMAAIITSGGVAHGFPTESSYVKGFVYLAIVAAAAAVAALFIPSLRRHQNRPAPGIVMNPELATVASGTLLEDESV